MSSDRNPYQPCSTFVRDEGPSPKARLQNRLLWGFAYLYPIYALVAFYGTWLVAWATLGHMPRPSLDDPKSIGVVIRIVYFVSMIPLSSGSVLGPLGLIASFFLPLNKNVKRRVAMRCLLAVIYIAGCFITLQILWADPYQVVKWHAD